MFQAELQHVNEVEDLEFDVMSEGSPPSFQQATARSRFPPIAPPSAPLTNAPPSASEHGEGVISREPSGEPSGKELDLFYRDGELNGGFGRARGGVGAGGGRNGGGGSGDGRSGDRIRQGQHAGIVAGAGTTPGGLPSERTSYMFCPEAHGMMRYSTHIQTYTHTTCVRTT